MHDNVWRSSSVVFPFHSIPKNTFNVNALLRDLRKKWVFLENQHYSLNIESVHFISIKEGPVYFVEQHCISLHLCWRFVSDIFESKKNTVSNIWNTYLRSFHICIFQAYIKIYQGEELPEPKSMLMVWVIFCLSWKPIFVLGIYTWHRKCVYYLCIFIFQLHQFTWYNARS